MITSMRTKRIVRILVKTGLLLAIGVSIGIYVAKGKGIDECGKAYTFLNQSAICAEQVISKTAYTKTQREISQYVETARLTGKAKEVSVYFRDLNNGPVFGLNELDEFVPASLLKLPLAFVYLTVAEIQPGLLAQRIQYTAADTTAVQYFKGIQTVHAGEEHTVEELLELMLTYSDNNAQELLSSYLETDSSAIDVRAEIFNELGLTDPETAMEESLSVRGYAALFRLLYNASFLNAEQSEKVLGWLSRSDFKEGLTAGVPEGIIVAHKFGERSAMDSDERQLHDCGIVYYPENPYLLCIMTKGDNWEELAKVIADISRTIFEEVNSRRI